MLLTLLALRSIDSNTKILSAHKIKRTYGSPVETTWGKSKESEEPGVFEICTKSPTHRESPPSHQYVTKISLSLSLKTQGHWV